MANELRLTDLTPAQVVAIGTTLGGAVPVPVPGPTPTPTPVPPQPTILKMIKPGDPGAGAPGATVELGDPLAPDLISLVLSSSINLGTGADPTLLTDPNQMCWIGVQIAPPNGPVIAGPLYVSKSAGEDAGQRFLIHGNFGAAGQSMQLLAGAGGAGLGNLWIPANTLTYNFAGYKYNGPAPWSPGPGGANFTGTIWDEFRIPLVFSTIGIAAPPPPTPNLPAPQTPIAGATINGVAQPTATFAALVASAPANSLLKLPGGTFLATAQVNVPLTIQGTLDSHGNKITILDGGAPVLGAGLVGSIEPTQKKAGIVPTVAGTVYQDLIGQNYAINNGDGGNAAFIRQAGPGYGFKAINVEVRGCQNGWLTFGGGLVELEDCYTHDNGNGDPGGGFTHESYFGGGDFSAADASAVKTTRSIFQCGLWSCHPIHCDARQVDLISSKFIGNPGDGTPRGPTSDPTKPQDLGGSILDFPIGATVNITDCDAIMPTSEANHEYIQCGEQSQPVPATMNLSGLRLHGPAGFFAGGSSWTLNIGPGCTYDGTTAPTSNGFAASNGGFAPSGV